MLLFHFFRRRIDFLLWGRCGDALFLFYFEQVLSIFTQTICKSTPLVALRHSDCVLKFQRFDHHFSVGALQSVDHHVEIRAALDLFLYRADIMQEIILLQRGDVYLAAGKADGRSQAPGHHSAP